MVGKILYKSSIRRDLKQIDSKSTARILGEIRTTLEGNPRAGEGLRGEFRGLFKLRIGDYQVIYTLIDKDVLVLRIRHRSKVYE